MKTTSILMGLLVFSEIAHTQTWAGSGGPTGDAYRTGNVGIGTTSPGQILDVRGGILQVINTASQGYSYLGRDAAPGNDSYVYHRMTTNYHLLGSAKNGSGTLRKLGFAIGGNDTESDVKMTINSVGDVGMGVSSPLYRLHVKSDAGNMTNNPQYSDDYYIEPQYFASYHELLNTNKYGWHAALCGYDLNDAVSGEGGEIVHGVGIFGKAERTSPIPGGLNIGIYGRALGASLNSGGIFYGDSQMQVGDRASNSENENGTGRTGFGVWASCSSVQGAAGYFNGTTYATSYYQSSDVQLKKEIKPLENALNKIALLKPNYFVFKTEEYKNLNLPEGIQMGLTAQDLEKDFPELTKDIKDISELLTTDEAKEIKSYKVVNYANLIPLLIAGVQEQQTKVEEQQRQIEEQKAANENLVNLVRMQQQKLDDLQIRNSSSTGVQGFANAVVGFSMDQNIPNPFDGETVINYHMPQQINKASINVYDLSGKQLLSLPLNSKDSAIKISSEKLSAGIYIYSIIADGKVMDSKRMVVSEK